ncbi:carbohydrate ABC transporter permease [Glycomyces algeriensis]|uniref:Sugar ABC transporter permease n=1 Tax=Glycomyces algeriensis TaxID=256037 RepID=A0A9W6LIX7_9ACTN|nr:sugar ABC transporter permease [Glycomyces algeriensis]MDA1365710.1 sugar ABC transporter permease [Glycomyces algeriensis]MDR7351398.1 multiple sugar transport system permease protein/raffinose/stachyose/melibiose transport system permease protein [Glycomyces algeriensis]GLI44116.1 sugar ABC transporter permease [Glycomyces algeriensis]
MTIASTDRVAAAAAAADRVPTPQRHNRRRGNFSRSEQRAGTVFAIPAIVLLLLFVIGPAVVSLAMSFTNARLISPVAPEFVGLDNFRRAFTEDPVFTRSMLNTFVFAALVVPLQGGLGLVLALLVNQKIAGRNFFRTVYFLPVITSMVVISLLWRFLYQEDGLINSTLSMLTGGVWAGQAWLSDPSTAMGAIVVMSVWQGVGFHMIIWLAGLQTIPEEIYEAAALDGTTRWEQFRHITLPLLKPTFVFVLITITIAAMSLFIQVDIMTGGGPLNSTSSIVYQIVQKGFQQQQIGYAASLSLVFFCIVLTLALIQRRLTRDKD